jgi:SPASM domain peptide maturase of grasp-with-spasm system
MNDKVIKLFESCFITRGYSRSVILDFQREGYYLVPNSLINLFDENNVLKIDDYSSKDDSEIIDEYIQFLIDNELCFYCDKALISNFPKMEIHNWDYPAKITNAIVELNTECFDERFNLLKELTGLFLTRYIELHFVGAVTLQFLHFAITQINSLDLYGYNVNCSLTNNEELDDVIRFIKSNHKIFRTTIGNAGENTIIDSGKYGWGNIFLLKDIFSYKSCGIVDQFHFSTTLSHFTESINHNTCLNRKLTIDIDGNIKNCPNTYEIHGNIKKDLLHDVLEKVSSKYWNIRKDDIKICKDCEFRHICTDCRAFLEDPNDLYSKPLKCGYSPYTCEWEEWSLNPVKQSGIEFYKLREFC